ncbi:TPA: hypothetical protein PIW00_004872 [Klebsiella quasipneumoniae subsp. similipneumoniae]|nr:hypothetical protein [Klebsiella aerogenes]HDH1863474.1 hypothetical protein [Klebsiella quasipneumoniae subsp. similipneumoniae]
MDKKSAKILELFKQLEAEGLTIIPINNKSIESIKKQAQHNETIEEKLKKLSEDAQPLELWIQGGWKMSF